MDKYKFTEDSEKLDVKERPIQVITEVVQTGSITTIQEIEDQIAGYQAQIDALTAKLTEIKKQTGVK